MKIVKKYEYRIYQQGWKKIMIKKKIGFLLFKLNLLFKLIIFSSKKIIKFYYKTINVLFFFY